MYVCLVCVCVLGVCVGVFERALCLSHVCMCVWCVHCVLEGQKVPLYH